MGLTWRLLQEVWGQRQGYVFLPEKAHGRWIENTAWGWPDLLERGVTIDPANDVYFSPLVFSHSRRKKEYALPTHVLWADLDEADPLQCALRPSACWQTTQGVFPHWQALWFLTEEVEAQDAAELSRRIAYGDGADRSGWDITQVLRLPGTYNHKHEPPQPVTLLWAERRYYTVAQVEAAYPPVPDDRPLAIDRIGSFTGSVFPPFGEIDAAIKKLPYGVRRELDKTEVGDRSLALLRLAEVLVQFRVDAGLIPFILQRAPYNKFRSRRDEQERLAEITGDALLSYSERSGG